MDNSIPQIILKPSKGKSISNYHPWIFSGAIKSTIGNIEEGDIVEVYTKKNDFLAVGHYQESSIAVRILSFEKINIDINFWEQKIEQAYKIRKSLGLTQTQFNNTYRLVNAEGDNLPGLIIDYYNGVAIIQVHSVGMYRTIPILEKVLKKLFRDELKAIYNKSKATLPFKSLDIKNEFIWKTENTLDHTIIENNLKFYVDWEEGQKTGFFIDQRKNRKKIEEYANGRSVLNLFCYTGGFSVYALQGNAKQVHSVDSSAKAIELTNKNIALNFENENRHTAFTKNVFDFLDTNNDKYDLIILDPPAFAKHKNVVKNAIQGYKRLNVKALEQIQPGGIIFTFSCSQVISKDLFKYTIASAAKAARRNVKIIEQLSQSDDHLINIYHPEGEYLKGLILYVN